MKCASKVKAGPEVSPESGFLDQDGHSGHQKAQKSPQSKLKILWMALTATALIFVLSPPGLGWIQATSFP